MVTAALSLVAGAGNGDSAGWRLVWSDDFNTFDDQKWDRVESYQPTNNSKHAYLPEQISVPMAIS